MLTLLLFEYGIEETIMKAVELREIGIDLSKLIFLTSNYSIALTEKERNEL